MGALLELLAVVYLANAFFAAAWCFYYLIFWGEPTTKRVLYCFFIPFIWMFQ